MSGPFLVVGDFNAPVESVIYRRYWGDLRNAFSYAGFGFGSTRLNGWIRVRIDHILASYDLATHHVMGPRTDETRAWERIQVWTTSSSSAKAGRR